MSKAVAVPALELDGRAIGRQADVVTVFGVVSGEVRSVTHMRSEGRLIVGIGLDDDENTALAIPGTRVVLS